ncbi:hypothetical protein, partial [Nonomuraea rhizosphaerae]|uniref:hypothetical protein n=1 Tax=Nonomuraea rhizosphaerae TaxID=2665663 RepID=UPI001C5F2157
MTPESGAEGGQARRASLALLALGITAATIYGLFSSGFGRLHRTTAQAPVPVQAAGGAPPPPARRVG